MEQRFSNIMFVIDKMYMPTISRLQKLVLLLQFFGYPTDYIYKMHFGGPYSEDLYYEIDMLKLTDYVMSSSDGMLVASDNYKIEDDLKIYDEFIGIASKEDEVVLELAATMVVFLQWGYDKANAILKRTVLKKGKEKCTEDNMRKAVKLLLKLSSKKKKWNSKNTKSK